MVFLFVLMVALCLGDFVSDRISELLHRLREPRPRLVRARRYRFN